MSPRRGAAQMPDARRRRTHAGGSWRLLPAGPARSALATLQAGRGCPRLPTPSLSAPLPRPQPRPPQASLPCLGPVGIRIWASFDRRAPRLTPHPRLPALPSRPIQDPPPWPWPPGARGRARAWCRLRPSRTCRTALVARPKLASPSHAPVFSSAFWRTLPCPPRAPSPPSHLSPPRAPTAPATASPSVRPPGRTHPCASHHPPSPFFPRPSHLRPPAAFRTLSTHPTPFHHMIPFFPADPSLA